MTLRDFALALLVPLLWGYNFVVMKFAVGEVPPLLLVALRFFLAAVPLVFFIRKPDASWHVLVGYAVAFAMVKFALLFTAFKLGCPAGIASVVLQSQAVFTSVLALLVFGERPAGGDMVGLAFALAGLGFILSAGAGQSDLLPVALVLAAAFAWTIANILNKSAARADPLGFVVWTAAIAAGPMLVASLLVEGSDVIGRTWQTITPLGVLAVLYLAYPVSILSGAIWSRLLTRYPAATISPFALLTPCIGLVASAATFGETLAGKAWAGVALVLIGLAVTTVRPLLLRRRLIDR